MTITIEITTEEVLALFQKDEVESTPAPTVAKPKPKKKAGVDVGKMKAPRDAGWSMQKIADEMRVSLSTVSKKLNEGG